MFLSSDYTFFLELYRSAEILHYIIGVHQFEKCNVVNLIIS